MNTEMMIELVGYLGSGLVLVSFLMSSVVKLRIINSIGGLIFAVYAMIIHSYPTALMNVCLVMINLYYLRQLRGKGKNYDLLSVDREDDFLRYILKHYKEDIESCFPDLQVDMSAVNRAFLVCCDTAPAGVMLGHEENGTLDVFFDYSTPMYRDCSIGEYLFSMLQQRGLRTISYSGPTENHESYLLKMGFIKTNEKYIKTLR